MENWFTTEQIDENTYAISEYGHWEEVHAYLLIGTQKALLIDTGLGIADIKNVVQHITHLPVQVATTHVHWDHIGGHGLFNYRSVHEMDLEWIRHGIPLPLERIRSDLVCEPFRVNPPDSFLVEHYHVFTGEPERVLRDGDLFDLGSRQVFVIHTPGHSPGHICLYEPARGYLFTGDLLYKGTLYAFYLSTDPVAYKQSIDRLCLLSPITRILPGHHSLDIPSQMLYDAKAAFTWLEDYHLLHHAAGIFQFNGFQIKL